MRGISTAHKNALLTTEVAAPLYLALLEREASSADVADTLAECSFTGYSRAVIGTLDWGAPMGGTIRTIAAVSFSPLLAGSTTIVGWALLTALTDGDVVWFGPLAPRVLDVDDAVLTIASGALALSLADVA